MSTKPKKIPRELLAAVAAAKLVAEAKKQELAEAEGAVARLKAEWIDAMQSIREAQERADAVLPQCRIVSVSRYSSKEVGGARVVILRRTPAGTLIVRHLGDADRGEYKFRFSTHSEAYREVEKEGRFSYSDRSELRDVPAEYMPAVLEGA